MMLLVLLAAMLMAGNLVQAHKYTVWVGFEKKELGLEINRMIPEVLKIHRGDTVVFRQMSHDPHTVTFHPGTTLPDLFLNGVVNMRVFLQTPVVGAYNGSYFVSSGLMAKGSPSTKFNLTFSALGEFKYGCSVHGPVQNGSIIVVEEGTKIPEPADIDKRLAKWAKNILKRAPEVYAQGLATVPKRTKNPDGTHTHYVKVGYLKGIFEFMAFFPRVLQVGPGDTVEWSGATFHTITFNNGNPSPPLFVAGPSGLGFNPVVVIPANASVPLTRAGFVNSGLITNPTIKFSLKIGSIKGSVLYVCLPHETSGMTARLVVKEDD